jgi:hypothetical protein
VFVSVCKSSNLIEAAIESGDFGCALCELDGDGVDEDTSCFASVVQFVDRMQG